MHKINLNSDVRFWLGSGTEHSINENVHILNELESGTWDLYLEIADAAPRLQRVPEYSILAVNQVPAVQQEGMNDLLRTLQVNALISTPIFTGKLGPLQQCCCVWHSHLWCYAYAYCSYCCTVVVAVT